MYEIELKAHVYDRENLIRILHSFADYRGRIAKYDSYWKQTAPFAPSFLNKTPITQTPSLRIRIEKSENENNPLRTLVTCKQKNIGGTSSGGKEAAAEHRDALEINKEHEFTVSDAAAFERLIISAGFSPFLTKHKDCLQWTYENVLIELCTVEDLGDFLELEITGKTAENAESARAKLESILKKCGIPLAQIEPMYYSELLAAQKSAAGKKQNITGGDHV
ncbi:CYTH domain-containing protein [Treponema sp. OMZ 840]|uniref:CYTH domain-containing protein n=1 Tax=Treponema sp. OMZ 840 TaxID=244313 RepID=UPI003D8CD052